MQIYINILYFEIMVILFFFLFTKNFFYFVGGCSGSRCDSFRSLNNCDIFIFMLSMQCIFFVQFSNVSSKF